MTANRTTLAAVLFDLDGTLVDSEPLYYLADRRFIEERGVRVPDELWPSFTGMGTRAFLELMQREWGLAGSISDLVAEKDESYLSFVQDKIRAFPQIALFARKVKEAGLGLAVASGSSPAVIRSSISWGGFDGLFDELVSSEEVERGKPAPDVFLESARRLGVEPEDCLVFEDAAVGVLAAKAARMRCVAVPRKHRGELDPVFRDADFLYQEGPESFRADEFIANLAQRNLWPRHR